MIPSQQVVQKPLPFYPGKARTQAQRFQKNHPNFNLHLRRNPGIAGGGLGHVPGFKGGPKPSKAPGAPGGHKQPKTLDQLLKGWDPNAPLTGKQLKRTLLAGQRLQFDPLERQLSAEHGASVRREDVELPAWFGQYDQSAAASKSSSDAAYQKAQDYLAQRLTDAGGQDAAERARLDAADQADAAKRGTSVDPTLAHAAVAAAAARQGLQAQQAGAIATQGANQSSYLGDKRRIGHGEQIHQMLEESRRRRGIESDQRTLAGKKGDWATQFLSDARSNEQKYNLGLATIKGENSRAKLSSSTTRRGQDITAAHNAATESAAIARIKNDLAHNRITAAQADHRIKLEKKRIQIARANAKGKHGGGNHFGN